MTDREPVPATDHQHAPETPPSTDEAVGEATGAWAVDRIRASFVSPEAERAYRERHLRTDARRLAIGLSIYAIPTIAFALTDHALFGYSTMFAWLVAARVVMLAALGAGIFISLRARSHRTLDNGVLVSIVVCFSMLLCINLSRPPEYHQHSTMIVVGVLSIYAFTVVRLSYQVAVALALTGFHLYVLLVHRDSPGMLVDIVTWVSFVFAHVVGFWAAWHLHTFRRRHFAANEQRQATLDQLKEANSEITTLRGLLPVCSVCNRIRDDEGRWHDLTTYLADHSDVKFSHSFCPKCLAEKYPDSYARLKEQGKA